MNNYGQNDGLGILVSAAGTGGHVIPAIQLCLDLAENGHNVIFITDQKSSKYVTSFGEIEKKENIKVIYLDIKYGGGSLFTKIKIGIQLFGIGCRIIKIIRKEKVKIAIGFGSYISIPVSIASFFSNKYVFVHEQNSHMGLSNRICSGFAKAIMLTFPETSGVPFFSRKKTIFTGMPLRKKVTDLHYQNTIETINYEAFFKIYNNFNIFIIGGSDGASFFGETISDSISLLPKEILSRLFIYHQTRPEQINEVEKKYNTLGIRYQIKSFFEEAPEIMSRSHLVISRSGAGAISEIAALGCPTIMIPYQYAANNHQLKNALFLQKSGAGILIEQKNVTPNKISDLITKLFFNTDDLFLLSHNAKQLAEINASKKIMSAIEKLSSIKIVANNNNTDEKKISVNRVGLS